jgi:hypothetical protein
MLGASDFSLPPHDPISVRGALPLLVVGLVASGGSLRTMKYISTCFTLGHRDCATFSERTGGGFRGYYTLETLRKPLSAQTVTLTPQRG